MFRRHLQRQFCVWIVAAHLAASLSLAKDEVRATVTINYGVSRWTTDDGLPQNRISCLKQTRDGYLWIGTWWGLARFDGVRFTVFDKYNTPEFLSDAVNALAEDKDGTLWIGTQEGLLRYQDRRFQRVSTTAGLPDLRVWNLVASAAGGLWVRAGDSVARFDHGQVSRAWKLPESSRYWLHESGNGSLDIVTDRHWLKLSPTAGGLRTNEVAWFHTFDWSAGVVDSATGNLWVGTRQGLFRHQHGEWQASATNLFASSRVTFLHADRTGGLWLNSQPGGLYRGDKSGWSAIGIGSESQRPEVFCMEEDREGNLWLGTSEGLVRLQPRRIRTFTTYDGLPHDEVWSICEARDATIWIGTRHGLARIRDDTVIPGKLDELTSDFANRCVWPAQGGAVWVAKPGYGILKFHDRLVGGVGKDDLPHMKINALYEDRAGRLWIGTERGVVARSNGMEVARFAIDQGRPVHDVRAILEDRHGDLWFGTHGHGLTRLRENKFEVFTRRDGLSNDRVWSIYEDADGALWLATENGLTRYRDGRFFAFTRQHGLLENAVNWILEDDFGFLWLSGLRGIYRIERRQLNAVAEGRAASVMCAAFGTADGMESSETNGENQPAGWKARDGRLWFPTIKGVVVIDPKYINVNDVPPCVVIEQIKANEEVVFGDGERSPHVSNGNLNLKLPAGGAGVLEVHYTANSFSDPRRVRFRYRLTGQDSRWREASERRTAVFTDLRPGAYRFEVMACNNHGVWNASPVAFAFSLAPHVWQTSWFYAGCAVAFVGVALGIQSYRLRWQRRLLKAEEQRTLALERTRIARDLHDDLGTALTGLALELDVIGRDSRNGTSLPEHLSAAATRTRQLAEQMREVVWMVNPHCDTASSLASFLEQQVEQFLRAEGIQIRLDFPENIPSLPVDAEARHHLALGVREALTNVVRHSGASLVTVSLAIDDQALIIRVTDNGHGFHPLEQSGHGLANLRSRLEQLGGAFGCVSVPGKGTTVTLRVPLKQRPSPSEKSA